MTKYSTKRALIASILTLALCFTSLIGTTFAWFTDSATSGGNVIQSGKLDVELHWAEGDEDPASAAWKNAEDGAIFNYDKWEPGYVEAKHLKIKNAGNIALKYKLSIVPDGTVEDLADVIDVYYVEGATLITRDSLVGLTPVGTLRDMIEEPDGAIHGALLPAGESATNAYERVGEVTATIAFKMREDAGNDYQGKKIGAEFAIQLLATQYAYENDSFNNRYDEPSEYPYVSVPEKVDGAATEDIVLKAIGKKEKAATVTVPAALANAISDSDSSIESIAVAHTEPKVEGNAIVFDDIAIIDQDGNVVDLETLSAGVAVAVTLPAQTVFAVGETVVIYHDDVAIGNGTVNADTTISYTAEHFCEVTVSYGDGEVNSSAELAVAVGKGGNITLADDVVISSTIVIPEGVELTLDLNGYEIKGAIHKSIGAIINNYGKLTIKNGTVSSEAENGGSAIMNNGTLVAEDLILNGAPNGGGNWPSYAVNNVGRLDATRVLINSYHGAVSSYNDGALLTLNNCEINMTGIPGFTSHGMYTFSNGAIVVNGGTYKNNAADQVATGASVINGFVTVNSGSFSGRIENYNASPVLKGGSYDVAVPEKYVPDGYVISEENGVWTVSPIPADAVAKLVSAAGKKSYYSSLSEAVAALTNGATLTLMNDVTLDSTLEFKSDVSATLDLAGYTVSGVLGTLVKISDGNLTIKNGSLSNEHEKADATKYAVYMSGDAVATVKNVNIAVSGTGIYLTENAKIVELSAKIDAYHTANGYCTYDAISVDGNARIDLISGGEYTSFVSDAYIAEWNVTHSYSGINSYALRINSAGASVGEIRGGSFFSGDDRSNTGAIINVNSGKIELISGGYFGFVKFGLQSPWKILFVNNGATLGKITGGTFEVSGNAYGCKFADIVDASGCQIVDTGVDLEVKAQLSTSIKSYSVNVYEVVAK